MLYTKTINDRQVFSTCQTVKMPDGTVVSNPSAEQITEAGWSEYVAPVVPPSPKTEPDFEDIVTAVKKMLASEASSLTDEEALAISALYPSWASKIGESVSVGERLWYDGNLYKVIQPHTPQADWTPDTTPALFAKVSIEEWPEIPETITAENPWMNGDKGTWKGMHYICKMDNCVWNPDIYPAAWELSE